MWFFCYRVFIESPMLESGVVLIDLPGRQDSSPSRSKMADDFLQSADVVMIVTDCHRAVDSKSGSDLLQRKLEQAIMMDARGDSEDVVIFCTKADNISAKAAEGEAPDPKLRDSLKVISEKIKGKKATVGKLEAAVKKCRQQIKALGKAKEKREEKELMNEELEDLRDEL